MNDTNWYPGKLSAGHLTWMQAVGMNPIDHAISDAERGRQLAQQAKSWGVKNETESNPFDHSFSRDRCYAPNHYPIHRGAPE